MTETTDSALAFERELNAILQAEVDQADARIAELERELLASRGRIHDLKAAIRSIEAHATPLGADADGFVATGYLVSVGSLHRALGIVNGSAPAGKESSPRCESAIQLSYSKHPRRCSLPKGHADLHHESHDGAVVTSWRDPASESLPTQLGTTTTDPMTLLRPFPSRKPTKSNPAPDVPA